jgi:hypothetical protein
MSAFYCTKTNNRNGKLCCHQGTGSGTVSTKLPSSPAARTSASDSARSFAEEKLGEEKNTFIFRIDALEENGRNESRLPHS